MAGENEDNGGKIDDGAAAEDATGKISTGGDTTIRELDGGAVEVTMDGVGAERTARHSDTDNEDVATHDATGRELSEEEREVLRTKRRDEKKRRRTAAREREERLRSMVDSQSRTIGELTQRLAGVEQRGAVTELQGLEKQIREAMDSEAYYKHQYAAAIQANNGTAAAEMSDKMSKASQQAAMLSYQFESRKQALMAPPQQRTVANPAATPYANAWVGRNKWYKRGSQDNDSLVTTAIDLALTAEGRDPASEGYWEELTRRVSRALPHRFKDQLSEDDLGDDDDDANRQDARGAAQRDVTPPKKSITPPRITPGGGGGNSDNSGRAGTFVLSSERVQAIKDAGYWGDSEKRNKMIRKFAEYDKTHRSGGAR